MNNDVYVIIHNDILLADVVYWAFNKACDACESILEFRPAEADRIYEVKPMAYVKVKSMGLL